METVRIYQIPDCKVVSSGIGMFGDIKFDIFEKWISSLPETHHYFYPRDFLFQDGEGLHWVWMYENGMDIPNELEIIDFKGGLYAVQTGIDQKTDIDEMFKIENEFLSTHGFEIDTSRPRLGNIITPPMAKSVLGYEQMNYYTPIKLKNK